MSVSAKCVAGTWSFSQEELLNRPPETGIAIDSPGPQEIDDAIRVGFRDRIYEVAIHISDCGIINPDSLEAQDARRRGWSRYTRGAKRHREDHGAMLPEDLYRGLLNLDADHDGLGVPTVTVSFDFEPENDGISNFDIQPTRLIDCSTTNYSEFNELIRGGNDHAVRIATVAELLGKHIGVSPKAPSEHIAQYSVQMMMIITNHLVAKEAQRQGIPWIYRNQKRSPPRPKLEHDNRDLDEPQEDIPASLLPVTTFSTIPSGHETLGLYPYAGFTSPLRKYPDLINHLILAAVRNGDELPFSVAKLDKIARDLTKRQRDRLIGRQALRAIA